MYIYIYDHIYRDIDIYFYLFVFFNTYIHVDMFM